jgi:hypothetical protein
VLGGGSTLIPVTDFILATATTIFSEKTPKEQKITAWNKVQYWFRVSVSQYSVWSQTGQGFDPRQRQKDFSSSLCPDRLWAPPSLLSNGYRAPFPGVKRGRGVTLTTLPHPVPRSRMRRSYTSFPPWRLQWWYQDRFTLPYGSHYDIRSSVRKKSIW